jgi:hypothetical protein
VERGTACAAWCPLYRAANVRERFRYFDFVLEDFFAGAFELSEVVSHAG